MPSLCGFHHVKLPVSDVAESMAWYQRVLSFSVEIEFVEQGVLAGVGLIDGSGTTRLALRHRPDMAAHLTGFDPVAIAVPTLADLREWAEHFDRLGVAHGGVGVGHVGWLIGDLVDPDGIEIRLYTLEEHGGKP